MLKKEWYIIPQPPPTILMHHKVYIQVKEMKSALCAENMLAKSTEKKLSFQVLF